MSSTISFDKFKYLVTPTSLRTKEIKRKMTKSKIFNLTHDLLDLPFIEQFTRNETFNDIGGYGHISFQNALPMLSNLSTFISILSDLNNSTTSDDDAYYAKLYTEKLIVKSLMIHNLDDVNWMAVYAGKYYKSKYNYYIISDESVLSSAIFNLSIERLKTSIKTWNEFDDVMKLLHPLDLPILLEHSSREETNVVPYIHSWDHLYSRVLQYWGGDEEQDRIWTKVFMLCATSAVPAVRSFFKYLYNVHPDLSDEQIAHYIVYELTVNQSFIRYSINLLHDPDGKVSAIKIEPHTLGGVIKRKEWQNYYDFSEAEYSMISDELDPQHATLALILLQAMSTFYGVCWDESLF